MAALIITPAQEKVSKFRITGQNREKYLLNNKFKRKQVSSLQDAETTVPCLGSLGVWP
jgi:hypothetical protein